MIYVTFFLLLIISALFQYTVLGDVNLLAGLAVFLGLKKGVSGGLLGGAACGAAAGIFSGNGLALNMSLYAGVGTASGFLYTRFFYRGNAFSEFVFMFAGILCFYAAFSLFTGTPNPIIFYSSFLSALLSFFFSRMLREDCHEI